METIVLVVHKQDMETTQYFIDDFVGAKNEASYWLSQGAEVEVRQIVTTTEKVQ